MPGSRPSSEESVFVLPTRIRLSPFSLLSQTIRTSTVWKGSHHFEHPKSPLKGDGNGEQKAMIDERGE
jgi:hypothetical protein